MPEDYCIQRDLPDPVLDAAEELSRLLTELEPPGEA